MRTLERKSCPLSTRRQCLLYTFLRFAGPAWGAKQLASWGRHWGGAAAILWQLLGHSGRHFVAVTKARQPPFLCCYWVAAATILGQMWGAVAAILGQFLRRGHCCFGADPEVWQFAFWFEVIFSRTGRMAKKGKVAWAGNFQPQCCCNGGERENFAKSKDGMFKTCLGLAWLAGEEIRVGWSFLTWGFENLHGGQQISLQWLQQCLEWAPSVQVSTFSRNHVKTSSDCKLTVLSRSG